MEARELEGRSLRAGKKEPADSWRGRDPHRTIDLEGFDSILRIDREVGTVPGIELSQVQSISIAGKSYSGRRLLPSIKSVSVNSRTCLRRTTQHVRQQCGAGIFPGGDCWMSNR